MNRDRMRRGTLALIPMMAILGLSSCGEAEGEPGGWTETPVPWPEWSSPGGPGGGALIEGELSLRDDCLMNTFPDGLEHPVIVAAPSALLEGAQGQQAIRTSSGDVVPLGEFMQATGPAITRDDDQPEMQEYLERCNSPADDVLILSRIGD